MRCVYVRYCAVDTSHPDRGHFGHPYSQYRYDRLMLPVYPCVFVPSDLSSCCCQRPSFSHRFGEGEADPVQPRLMRPRILKTYIYIYELAYIQTVFGGVTTHAYDTYATYHIIPRPDIQVLVLDSVLALLSLRLLVLSGPVLIVDC